MIVVTDKVLWANEAVSGFKASYPVLLWRSFVRFLSRLSVTIFRIEGAEHVEDFQVRESCMTRIVANLTLVYNLS